VLRQERTRATSAVGTISTLVRRSPRTSGSHGSDSSPRSPDWSQRLGQVPSDRRSRSETGPNFIHYQAPTGARRSYSKMFELIFILVVIVLLVLGTWAAFNGLIKRRNRTQEAWSEIDVELKRRHDLVPNLVSTVQGYAAHEKGTFEAVTRARADAVTAGASGDPGKIAPAENALSGALRSLFAVAENYPQLRAVESFLQLQETLTSTEDKIEYARRYYNTSARDYNIGLQTFPRSLIAGLFHFKPVAFFAAQDDERAVTQLSLSSFGTTAGAPAVSEPTSANPETPSPTQLS